MCPLLFVEHSETRLFSPSAPAPARMDDSFDNFQTNLTKNSCSSCISVCIDAKILVLEMKNLNSAQHENPLSESIPHCDKSLQYQGN